MPTRMDDSAVERRVQEVVTVVHAVEPALSGVVVRDALLDVATTPHLRTRIAKFLVAHPEALTSGSSRAPKIVGRFIGALIAAGATRLVQPRCADCGQPKELFHTAGEDRICVGCYERRSATASVCVGCGKRCRPHGPTREGAPLCQTCHHKSRTVACSRCGRVRPVNYSRADGKPYCRGCRARNHLEPCSRCGKLRPVNTRDAAGRGLCVTCYAAHQAPREICTGCGTSATVAAREPDGGALCSRCYTHPARTCGHCGRSRRVALRATHSSPDVCPTCYQAPEITCSVCGTTALGRRTTADGQPMCFRCQATRLVDQALTGPTGTIPEPLEPVRDAVVAADNPRSVLANFTRDDSLAMLVAMAQGQRPLSHESLDEQAGRHSVEHLRSLLVAAGALPARDEYLHRLQRFTTDLIATVTDLAERRLLAAFTRWHLLARLRTRTAGNITPGTAYRCRADLTAAHRFLIFLRERGHDLAACTQDDLDTWFSQPTEHLAQASRTFLGWARQQRHLTGVTLPKRVQRQPQHFRDDDQRWDLAHRMLHDPTAGSVADRVAACLVLLYAQPPARIVALTREHIHTDTDGAVALRLGHIDVTIPPPLDTLLTQLPASGPPGTAARLHTASWLFPGRRPGQHLHPTSLANRLRALGVDPRTDRNTALLSLAAHIPPVVLADLLGLHIGTATKWADEAAGSWSRYAAVQAAHSRH